VERLEARTVVLEKTRKAILRGPTANEEAMIQWRNQEKKLMQDFNTTLETLTSTQDELASTQDELASTRDD